LWIKFGGWVKARRILKFSARNPSHGDLSQTRRFGDPQLPF
jgi:hypothetical protein